jgi:hypothetical protein
MKKALFLLICSVLVASACNNTKKESSIEDQAEKQEIPKVGDDTDAHGCKASAGFQWSVVKNECIRLFEEGIALEAKAEGLDKGLVAYVVFKSDTEDTQAELFLPGKVAAIFLEKTQEESAGMWRNPEYTLIQWKGMYSLEDSEKTLLYQGAAQ